MYVQKVLLQYFYIFQIFITDTFMYELSLKLLFLLVNSNRSSFTFYMTSIEQ